jgi:hypothetical protein
MAGRNIKNNADWFSHDADASSDEKVVYLESVFGHTGYAVYFKFLECMTRADGFKLQWNDIKKAIYASKFGISVTEMDRFITECCRQEVKAFEIDDGFIFSPGLIKRLEPLLSKREYNRQKYQEQKQEVEEKQNDNSISVTEMTQSKVKERKGYTPPKPPKGKIDELKDYLLKNTPKDMQAHVLKITEFYKYRQQKPKAKRYDTKKKINGLFRDLSNCMAAGYDISACMDIAMERGWMTPSVDYFKPEMFLAEKLNGKSQKSKEEILKQAGFSS